MAIKSNPGPANARAVMQRALTARLPQAASFSSPLGGAPQTGSPVPVHYLSLVALADQHPLMSTTVTSWLYPVIGGVRPGLADIRENAGTAGPSFGGLSQGILAARFIDACVLAEKSLAALEEEFEPRLLDAPALQFAALWLHGSNTEHFISLLDGKPPGSAPLRIVSDVVPDLQSRAAARSNLAGPAMAGIAPAGTPTN